MPIKAHGATLDITAEAVVITRSELAASLGRPAREEIALTDITEVDALAPTATAFGYVRLLGADVDIAFAPNQEAEAAATSIRAACKGELPAAPAQVSAGDIDTSRGVSGLDFTAVDVETANWNWGSICQIGAVRFRDGVEAEAKVWLCQPPAGLEGFDEVNISIHGITAEDVADAPDFDTAAAELLDFVGEDFFVAHNAQFDGTALRTAWQACGNEVPSLRFGCSLALARHCSAAGAITVANHKLPTVAKAVGFDSFKHHDACEDARAAGLIITGLAQALKFEGPLAQLFTGQGFTTGELNTQRLLPVLRANTSPTSAADLGAGTDFRDKTRNAGAEPATLFDAPSTPSKKPQKASGQQRGPAPWQSVATPDTIPDPNLDADPDNELFGQNVTLTGDFDPFDKGLLWNGIAERGGTIGKNVTKKTTILVLGAWATKTSKEKRAEELNEKGQGIQLWPAEKLFELLGLEVEPPF